LKQRLPNRDHTFTTKVKKLVKGETYSKIKASFLLERLEKRGKFSLQWGCDKGANAASIVGMNN
jgi:hypothetical protein